ncbi:MAG: radical SAM protein [bacterium]|nr:radical SAM protein [bacterium]
MRKDWIKALSDGVKVMPEDLVVRLCSERILQPVVSDWDDVDHRALVEIARSGTFRFICILPTNECVLSCRYCHQRTGRGLGQTMTRDEIIKGLQLSALLCTNLMKPVDILIYGGEPLLAFPLTEEILRLTRSELLFGQKEVRICFTTSGVGMTSHHAKVLAQNDVFVILSIDGLAEVNDKVRVGAGISAFKAVEQAYFLLRELGCRVGLSVTLGKHNTADFAYQVGSLLERFPPDDVGLNAFLHPCSKKMNPYQVSAESALPALISGWAVAQRHGVYAEQPLRRLRPFVFRNPLLKDCSSPGERLVLAPGGVIGFCDSCFPDRSWFYPYADFPSEDHPDYQLWASLSSPEIPQCSQCPAMTVCGGACRYDAYRASGCLDGVDPRRCSFERSFLNWMIWELFNKIEDKTEPWLFPEDGIRRVLIDHIPLASRNQPFTAGSFSQGRMA